MKPILKISLLITSIIMLSSFISNESELLPKNGFSYKGTFYELSHAVIQNNNGTSIFIQLSSNVDDENAANLSGVIFNVSEENLQNESSFSSDKYSITIGNTLLDNKSNLGEVVLNNKHTELYASDISCTIYHNSKSSISLSFSFLRNDGEMIRGYYNGPISVKMVTSED